MRHGSTILTCKQINCHQNEGRNRKNHVKVSQKSRWSSLFTSIFVCIGQVLARQWRRLSTYWLSTETWLSIGPILSRLSLLQWHPVPKVEEPESGPWTAHYWVVCHFYQSKPFWKWENQSSAQHRPVAVSKKSVGGQNWLPSAYRSYHSSNSTILATNIRQHFCRCWVSVGSYLTSHLGIFFGMSSISA